MNARTKLALMVLFLLALLLAGCSGATIRILPDVQFGRQAGDAPRTIVQHPRPVETRPQDVTVDKLVFVELPREFSSAAGTVFHILEHGCGLIAVKAPTPAGYRKGFVFQNPKPVPPHKYRLEFAVSSRTLLGTRRTGEEYVQADANLFDEQNVVAQSGQFVRTGGGIGYYGRGRDALGNQIYVGPQRTRQEAALAAIIKAVEAMCYTAGASHWVSGTPSSYRGGSSRGLGGGTMMQGPTTVGR